MSSAVLAVACKRYCVCCVSSLVYYKAEVCYSRFYRYASLYRYVSVLSYVVLFFIRLCYVYYRARSACHENKAVGAFLRYYRVSVLVCTFYSKQIHVVELEAACSVFCVYLLAEYRCQCILCSALLRNVSILRILLYCSAYYVSV